MINLFHTARKFIRDPPLAKYFTRLSIVSINNDFPIITAQLLVFACFGAGGKKAPDSNEGCRRVLTHTENHHILLSTCQIPRALEDAEKFLLRKILVLLRNVFCPALHGKLRQTFS